VRDMQDAAVKAQLRQNTEAAVALGLFGVPSLVVDGKLFWGMDALPMVRAYLTGDDWFDGATWDTAAALPVGIRR
jgi:2-hydroxychromene-2-carboxylate isomerase